MKKLRILFCLMILIILSGCSSSVDLIDQESDQQSEESSTVQTTAVSQISTTTSSTITENITSQTSESEEITMNHLVITVGNQRFQGTINEGETAEAFRAMLPLTVDMDELNGNEKYYYFPGNLPTNSQRVGAIKNGDLMLYGSNCLVLFYKSFPTSYTYSPIGAVDNPNGLAQALGRRGVEVTFELAE
ncbi:hypothetical protein JZO70_14665 [Enterococcus sp. 669A]|uniref:Cyclophilin-like domain-containing protein n=1 Tax=Candidatus Enterococcus moelleringii TaxID=2815325 RepID=A0ABS3LCQ5_9ENTE|nr:cyclophilin-like fold protein [Enterococcus sp. 669A]MBO1307417.1 hypothetical protein [Enterococcus sp. 669A]